MRTQGSAPSTSGMISRFSRDTVWLATGVLGIVIFAALLLAVQECQRKATEAERDLLLNANPAKVASVIAKSFNANGEMTPRPGSSVDHAFAEPPLQEISPPQTEPAASASVLALAPENRNYAQANPDVGTLARRQSSARLIGPKIRKVKDKSSGSSRYVGVKRRLIELWHESLAKSEKPRSWTAFSNLNSGTRKKAAYTAEMNR
jgi:hypothetical protein